MANKVIAIPHFATQAKRLVKKFSTLEQDLFALRESLLEEPTLGTSLGAGLYKIRVSTRSKGGGKSGGFRVITYLVQQTTEGTDVYLVTIYDKSEEDSIDKKDVLKLVRKYILSQLGSDTP